jgi:hypothetical protein
VGAGSTREKNTALYQTICGVLFAGRARFHIGRFSSNADYSAVGQNPEQSVNTPPILRQRHIREPILRPDGAAQARRRESSSATLPEIAP